MRPSGAVYLTAFDTRFVITRSTCWGSALSSIQRNGRYWLEIVEAANLIKSRRLEPLKIETSELIAIFVSLIKKWKGK